MHILNISNIIQILSNVMKCRHLLFAIYALIIIIKIYIHIKITSSHKDNLNIDILTFLCTYPIMHYFVLSQKGLDSVLG